MEFLFKNLVWFQNSDWVKGDIRIKRNVIREIGLSLSSQKREHVIDFSDHHVYPGLINSHDHLEMNLYPKLGNPPYKNYTEWGNDIYKPNELPISKIEKIPIDDRLLWGGLKNLISGATTVVHHNPWKRSLSSGKYPVNVLQQYTWAHSLSFGKKILKSFPKKANTPFIIHAAEGVDNVAFGEIQQLKQLGLLKSNTVLIHGVALSDTDIESIKQARSSLVWCPASNFFLFGATAPIKKLHDVQVALGSDSTLTGSPTLLEEMKVANETRLVTAQNIFKSVTQTPSKIFNLPEPKIEIGCKANLFITPKTIENYFESLIQTPPATINMVMVNGDVQLCDEVMAKQIGLKKTFSTVGGSRKWCSVDIARLKSRIYKVAGNTVEANPLWQLID